ncbi:hypothetical protein BC938DRAFT_471514, partial [Jimgerdemannia flammicorona]
MYGDVVKRSHQDLKSGVVVDVQVQVDLEHIATGKRLTGIDTTKLVYCWDFQEGEQARTCVWFGERMDIGLCGVETVFPLASQPENYNNGKWIRGNFDPQNHKNAVVIKMRTSKATVRWVAYNQLAPETLAVNLIPPTSEITDLNLLKPFHSFAEHATFDIGDTVLFRDKADAKVYGVDSKLSDPDNTFEPFDTSALRITNIRTTVDIEWQDLTVERNVPAIELLPYMNVDDQDVWPRDYVLDKHEEDVPEDDKENRRPERLGIVQSVAADERTCKVRWLTDDRSALE